MIFNDGTEWLVRFAQHGSVCGEYADEKVAMEVETLSLIGTQTDIPVPAIHAWGLAEANPLGLDPFIIMDFIDGVPLENILRKDLNNRLIRDDISDHDMEYIY